MHKKQNTQHDIASQNWYQNYTRFVQLKGLSERTRESYYGWAHQLNAHFPHQDLPGLPPERVLDFLVHLQDERKLAPATLNQAVCALRTLYRDHLDLNWDIWKKIHIKRYEPLPHVLTRDEVAKLLRTFRDGRYRAFCTVVYQCGLRLNEALSIKPKHINGERLVIYIPKTKNRKAREVPITQRLLERLRKFYATHMLEGGASVRQVAAYLGHSSLKEVIRYLHLTEISEVKGRDALATLADS